MSSSLAFAQPKMLTSFGNIKLVLVGTPGVGNTSFLVTTSSGRFPEEYVPQVNAEGTLAVTHKDSGKTVAITLWDTAGQEDYSRIRPLSYGNTDVFMIGYSVTDDDSLWRAEEMVRNCRCPGVTQPYILSRILLLQQGPVLLLLLLLLLLLFRARTCEHDRLCAADAR